MGLFVRSRGRAGFPFVLPRGAIETVECQIKIGDYSLQGLATAVRAYILALTRPRSERLLNVNDQQDWTTVGKRWRRLSGTGSKPRVGLQSGPK
jgi:hypothetical protein